MQFATTQLQGRSQAHNVRWHHCQGCQLCSTRDNVVLWRGYVPCDVVLLEDAPDRISSAEGYPHTGETKDLISTLIKQSQFESDWKFRWALSSMVSCRPTDDRGNNRPPSQQETDLCGPRLREFLALAQPKLVVLLGKDAAKVWDKGMSYPTVTTFHPSEILNTTDSEKAQRLMCSVADIVCAIEVHELAP